MSSSKAYYLAEGFADQLITKPRSLCVFSFPAVSPPSCQAPHSYKQSANSFSSLFSLHGITNFYLFIKPPSSHQHPILSCLLTQLWGSWGSVFFPEFDISFLPSYSGWPSNATSTLELKILSFKFLNGAGLHYIHVPQLSQINFFHCLFIDQELNYVRIKITEWFPFSVFMDLFSCSILLHGVTSIVRCSHVPGFSFKQLK